MKKFSLVFVLALPLIFVLSGCVVRTYKVTKDRTDQDLTEGNRGYLTGEMSTEEEEKMRSTTRTTRVIEVELHSPIKFEKGKKEVPAEKIVAGKPEEQPAEGNRGYITKSETPEFKEVTVFQKYAVQKDDSLQKISLKFYGTTKKWMKIYEANTDVLKGPNKIYPGQTINIPLEDSTVTLKEPKENLK
jgi:LysM repeat protein